MPANIAEKRSWLKFDAALGVAIAVLLYLPTTFMVGAKVWLLIIPFIVFKLDRIRFRSNDLLLILFLALVYLVLLASVATKAAHWSDFVKGSDIGLMVLTVMTGRYLAENYYAVRVLLVLFSIEAFVCLFEYVTGQPTIAARQAATQIADYDTQLRYFERVFGLSSNSSIAAQKMLLGVILVFWLKGERWRQMAYIGLFVLASFATFNRTAMVAMIVFLAIAYWQNRKMVIRSQVLRAVLITAIPIFLIAFAATHQEQIAYQLLRGNSLDTEVSEGRGWLWLEGLRFISDHWLLGNLGQPFRIFQYGVYNHLHNSYLEVIATHGLIIGGMYFVYIASLYRRAAFPAIFTILIYSLLQFGIGWAFSIMDVVFFAVLERARLGLDGGDARAMSTHISRTLASKMNDRKSSGAF